MCFGLIALDFFSIATYHGWSTLIVQGTSDCLYSKEGVTQGDPLLMFMYAIGTLPLIWCLHWTQVWYEDDTSAGGPLQNVHDWFTLLMSCGSVFGYFPEPSKSYLVMP